MNNFIGIKQMYYLRIVTVLSLTIQNKSLKKVTFFIVKMVITSKLEEFENAIYNFSPSTTTDWLKYMAEVIKS